MKTIVLTGAPEVGKSYCIYKLAGWLSRNGWKDNPDIADGCKWEGLDFKTAQQNYKADISQLFTKSGFNILLHAPMDTPGCVGKLVEFFRKLCHTGKKVDLLVTTLRRYDDLQHNATLNAMGWTENDIILADENGEEIIQIPLLKVKHESTDNKVEVIERYNKTASRLLQNIVDKILQTELSI